MTNSDKTKTFLLCALIVVWVLATIIVVARIWNTNVNAFLNVCGLITLAGSIVGLVRFTKKFIGDK